MRIAMGLVFSCWLGGCTLERIEQDTAQALGVVRLADAHSIQRSTRWRMGDPDNVAMVAAYDPNDAQQVAVLNAAYAGVTRIYPQTVLDRQPTTFGVIPEWNPEPFAVLIHVGIPSFNGTDAGIYQIALLDVRTGAVIDRAMLTLQPRWRGGLDDAESIARLFAGYAAQLQPVQ